MKVRNLNAIVPSTPSAPLPANAHLPEDWTEQEQALYTELAAWRRQEARRREQPPYLVLSNRSLAAVVHARPANLTQLRAIYGIGPHKMADLGPQLLAVLAQAARNLALPLQQDADPEVS